MTPTPRRVFLQVASSGVVGCALWGCSSGAATGGSPDLRSGGSPDGAAPADLRVSRDQAMTPPPPDLSPPADLYSPPDLSCGGIPVPAAYMPQLNEALFWPDHNVMIARDAGGYMAVAARCPHAGCAVLFYASRTNLVCPCHGSTFQLDGTFVSGLAGFSLVHLGLCWKDNTKQVLLLNPNSSTTDTSERVA